MAKDVPAMVSHHRVSPNVVTVKEVPEGTPDDMIYSYEHLGNLGTGKRLKLRTDAYCKQGAEE